MTGIGIKETIRARPGAEVGIVGDEGNGRRSEGLVHTLAVQLRGRDRQAAMRRAGARLLRRPSPLQQPLSDGWRSADRGVSMGT